MRIHFATHATSEDNEAAIASGWRDPALSEAGIRQAHVIRQRFAGIPIDLVCCSDLARASETARIAFADRLPIMEDLRLRETDYGDMNGEPREVVFGMALSRVHEPYPNGESHEQAVARVHDFLRELVTEHPGKTALIIGHRATRHGLDTFARRSTLEECLATPSTWQPCWTYDLTESPA